MKNLLWAVLCVLVGGATFWLVDLSMFLGRGDQFSATDAGLLTFLLPFATLSSYAILYGLRGRTPDAPSIALYMLLGVWALGPTCLMLFGLMPDWGWVATYTLNPMYTWAISTYLGSLFGLQIISVLLLIAHFVLERHHWIIPLRIFRPRPRLP